MRRTQATNAIEAKTDSLHNIRIWLSTNDSIQISFYLFTKSFMRDVYQKKKTLEDRHKRKEKMKMEKNKTKRMWVSEMKLE